MKIGYARVSTLEQILDSQEDALRADGCEKIFVEKASGVKADRPVLAQVLEFARDGDTIVIQKLDRLARSLQHLIELSKILDSKGIHLRILNLSIDTSTPGGRLVYHLIGAIAEFERDLIRERTAAGLEAARKRGKKGGRPRLLSERQIGVLKSLAADLSNPIDDICRDMKISRSTYYRYVQQNGQNAESATQSQI